MKPKRRPLSKRFSCLFSWLNPDDGLNFCMELGPHGKPQFPCHNVQTVIFKLDFHRRIGEDAGGLKEKALDIL
jgi:hypothetical protein